MIDKYFGFFIFLGNNFEIYEVYFIELLGFLVVLVLVIELFGFFMG